VHWIVGLSDTFTSEFGLVTQWIVDQSIISCKTETFLEIQLKCYTPKKDYLGGHMVRGYNTVSTLDPTQKQIYKGQGRAAMQGPQGYYQSPLYQQGSQYIQNSLSNDPQAYAAYEAPQLRQYQQNIGALSERFGGLGATSSSGFQQALSGATTDLQERLAQLRAGIQERALPQALQYAGAPLEHGQNLINTQTQAALPKQRPWWQEALAGLTSKLGNFY
jgi:hypothetical protein